MAVTGNLKTAIENFTAKIKTRFTNVEGRVTTLEGKVTTLESIDVIEVVSSKPTASASTMGKLYIVSENNEVNVYYTIKNGNSYSMHQMDTDILDSLTVNWSDINGKPSFGTGANDMAAGNHGHGAGVISTEISGITQTQKNQVYSMLELTGYDYLDGFLGKALYKLCAAISNKANSSDIPTNNNQLINGAGYITLADISDDLNIDLTGYVNENELIEVINYATNQFE